MKNIETVNIWRREHDGQYSVCVLSVDDADDGSRSLLERFKATRPTLIEVLTIVADYTGSTVLQQERIEAFHAGYQSNKCSCRLYQGCEICGKYQKNKINPALECQHRRTKLICGVRKCFDCEVDL